MVQAWAINASGRGVLTFTMKDSTVKIGLKLGDGRFCNVVGDVLAVFLPEAIT